MRPLAWLVATLVVGTATPALASDPGDDVWRAARETRFVGTVRVEWVDASGRHVHRLPVEGANGYVLVRGATRLLAAERARWVSHGDGWTLLWPPSFDVDEPSVEAKYDVDWSRGPIVLGRPTRLGEVRHARVLRERWYVDTTSGLLLRRDQFDADGVLRRTIAFERLETPPARPLMPPADARDHTPSTVAGLRLQAPYRAPRALDAGYRLVGAYREDHRVHVLYSDGVNGLSVFEQRGRLRRSDLPASARPVLVGGRTGWHLSWAGGDVVVWQAGSAVYVAVGDGPLADVVAAAASMPAAGNDSILARLRRACRALADVL